MDLFGLTKLDGVILLLLFTMQYEQVLLEVMQFTGYREDVQSAFFMNRGMYAETAKTRKTLADKRKTFYHTNYTNQVYREWYPNRMLKMREEFTNDDPSQYHGVTQYWYSNGKLKRVAPYHQNQRHGNVINYYPNGKVSEITPYYQDRIHGTHIKYNQDGTVYQTTQYHMDTVHGQMIIRFPNSRIISTVSGYRMGIAEGPWIINYPNGQPREVEHYVNGQLSGKYERWYPNGILEREQNFLAGELHGEQRFYTEKGKEIQYAMYEYGMCVDGTDFGSE